MVDVLDLELNTRQMLAAQQETERALRSLGDAAVKLGERLDGIDGKAKSTGQTFRGLSTTFRTAQEGLQLGGAVPRLVNEFNTLTSSTANAGQAVNAVTGGLFTLVGVGINIQQMGMAAQMAAAADQTGRFAGASSTLALIWRAHPVLTIVTVLGAVTAAIAAFTSSTKEAAKGSEEMAFSVDGLRAAMRSLSEVRAAQARAFEFGDVGELNRQRLSELDRLKQLSVNVRTGAKPLPVADLARALGTSEEGLRNVLRRGDIAHEDPAGRLSDVTNPITGLLRGRTGAFTSPFDPQAIVPGELGVRQGPAVDAIEKRIRMIERQMSGEVGSQFGRLADTKPTVALGPPPPPGFGEIDRSKVEAIVMAAREDARLAGLSVDLRQQEVAVLEAKRAAMEGNTVLSEMEEQSIRYNIELAQQLSDLRSLGGEVGTALGNAFFNAAENARNLRGVLAGLLSDLSNIARQIAVKSIANALGDVFTGFGSAPSGTGRGKTAANIT